MILYGLTEEQGRKQSKGNNMPKKKPPLVTPAEIEIQPHHPFPQVSLDTNKLFDQIHIRNTYIRAMNTALQDCEVGYNTRIEYLSRKWFSSPQNIERIITDNTDK